MGIIKENRENKVLLVEDTIFQILDKIDDDFFHHKKYFEHLKKNSWYRVWKIKNGDEIHFKVKPSGLWKTKHQQDYLSVLKVTKLKDITKKLPYVDPNEKDYKKNYKKIVEDTKKKVEDAIKNNDTEVFCTCKSASYFGYNYILTKVKSKFGTQEDRYPKIKNPKLRGAVCKHLHYILEDFKNPEILKIYIDILTYYVMSIKYPDENVWKKELKWKPTLQ